MDFLFVVIGLILLVFGGDWLLKSAVGMSLRLNVPKIVIGMTVVSFATSAPELIVSVKSALDGFPDIALGNVVGSNIANIGLILGIVMIISEMKVDFSFFKTDWPAMIIASILLYIMLFFGGDINRIEGGVFFLLLIGFIFLLLKNKPESTDEEIPLNETMTTAKVFWFLLIGGLALWGGSELLIKGAVNIAQLFGVSDRVIAVTVVAVGTSIPELAASIIAALKKESSISIGNVIGSNIFNIFSVLGIASLIHPIKLVDTQLMTFDILWMLFFAFVLLPLVALPKRGFLDRRAGIVLVFSYVLFVYLTFN